MVPPEHQLTDTRTRWVIRINRAIFVLAIVVFIAIAASRLIGQAPLLNAGPADKTDMPRVATDHSSTATGSGTDTPGMTPPEAAPEAAPAFEQKIGERLTFVAAGPSGFAVTVSGKLYRIGDPLPDGYDLVGLTLEQANVTGEDGAFETWSIDLSLR